MELVLWAGVLYLLQCAAFVPPGAQVFLGRRRARRRAGPGWQLLGLRPSQCVLVLAERPFRAEGDCLVSDQPLGRNGADPFSDTTRRLRLEAASEIAQRGSQVRVGGQTLLRAASPIHAAVWAGRIAGLAQQPPGERAAALAGHDAAALGVDPLREELDGNLARTRWLAWLLDGYGLAAFAVAPALIPFVGANAAWLGVAPLLAALHLACLVLLYRAHRALAPDAGGDRFEMLLTASLYPPLLLRSREALLRLVAARFHPAAGVALLQQGEARARYFRRAIARAELPGTQPLVTAETLRRLARTAGVTREELAAPAPVPGAAGFCPLCDDGYRPGVAHCRSCDSPTRPYPTAAGA